MKLKRYKSLYEQQYKIYCDMDGVLCDFDGKFKSLFNCLPQDYENKFGKEKFWNKIKTVDHWFLELPWIQGSQEFWNKIKPFNPTILTSPADSIEQCKKDKLEWIRRNIGNAKVIIDKQKFKYASPNSILIDDLDKNIEPWRKAGGVGIKFVNPQQAIKILGNMGIV